MKYLLDTNACIAVINGEPAAVRGRLQKALDGGADIFVSAIAVFELRYGIAKSARAEFNRRRLDGFLSGPIVVLPFDELDAEAAGAIRAALGTASKPIGAYDLLIAGQALKRGLTVITANVAEFSRVKGLSWQDWAKL